MGKQYITLETDKRSPKINHIYKPEKTLNREITTLKRKLHEFFTKRHTVFCGSEDLTKRRGKIDDQKVDRYQFTNSRS